MFSGLTASSYPVTVKDGNGCTSTAQVVTITEPDVISGVATQVALLPVTEAAMVLQW